MYKSKSETIKVARGLTLFSAGTGKASMHVPDLEQPEAK